MIILVICENTVPFRDTNYFISDASFCFFINLTYLDWYIQDRVYKLMACEARSGEWVLFGLLVIVLKFLNEETLNVYI